MIRKLLDLAGAFLLLHILLELVSTVDELKASMEEMHQDFGTHRHEGDSIVFGMGN